MHWKYRGMAFGMAFIIFFCGVWLAVPLQYELPSAPWMLAFTISAMLLVVGCVSLFRMASRTPADSGECDQDYFADRRKIRKTFGILFGGEIILIALAANVLPAIGLEPLAVPVIATIVGLHYTLRIHAAMASRIIARLFAQHPVSPRPYPLKQPNFGSRSPPNH